MTDRPAGIYFLCTCAVYRIIILTAVLIATPEAVLSLAQVIYCTGRIEDIKNNFVHYVYGESHLINEAISYFFELTCKYESVPYLLYT